MNSPVPAKHVARGRFFWRSAILPLAAILLLALAYFGSWALASYDDLLPYVLDRIDALGTEFCPQEVLLLGHSPSGGFSDAFLRRVQVTLEEKGCEVLRVTPDNLARFENPERSEWNSKQWVGARIASIRVSGHPMSGRPQPWYTMLWVGWLKGGIHGDGDIDLLYWNGLRWVKKGEARYRN